VKTARIAVLFVLLAACAGSTGGAQHSPTPRTPGSLGDTWTGDGATWRQHNVAGPAPRYFAALAYDAARHVYVMFGGQTTKGTSDETWTFGDASWTLMTPAHRPPPRRDAAMAYDPARRVVVLYGGLIPDLSEGVAASDTWTWNGVDWSDVIEQSKAPGPREGARMITAGNRVVLFGGRFFNLTYFGDAWTWDGTAWLRIDRSPTRPGRADAAVVWDPADSSIFVFGGNGIRRGGGPGETGVPLGDAWTFKGGEWSQIEAGPPALNVANAIWDPRTGRAGVIFGIRCPNPTNEIWGWNGTTWTHTQIGVPARWGAAVAQDTDGNALVFGGSDEPGC